MLKAVTITSMLLMSGAAFAQSVGNPGQPGRANTTDPNSAPMASPRGGPVTTGVDAAGRANTSDPNSRMSGGTNASGHAADPMANPRRR